MFVNNKVKTIYFYLKLRFGDVKMSFHIKFDDIIDLQTITT